MSRTAAITDVPGARFDQLGSGDVDRGTVHGAFGGAVKSFRFWNGDRDVGPLDDGHVGMPNLEGRTIREVQPEWFKWPGAKQLT